VKGLREKVEEMGYESKAYFTRIRPTLVEGSAYIRADVRKKEGGSFVTLGYWRTPHKDKAIWRRISNIMEPEWLVEKRNETGTCFVKNRRDNRN
jgi:hypothetical protein